MTKPANKVNRKNDFEDFLEGGNCGFPNLIKDLNRIFFQNNQFLETYNGFMIKYPLLGNSLTAGFGGAVGNSISQVMSSNDPFSVFKMLQFTFFGLLIAGPILSYWWNFLENVLFKQKNSFLRPVKLTIVDQVIMAWVLNALFVAFMSITDGKTLSRAYEAILNQTAPIVFEAYKVWPLVMMINFYLMPLHNRALFSNVVGILWNVYLSYLYEN